MVCNPAAEHIRQSHSARRAALHQGSSGAPAPASQTLSERVMPASPVQPERRATPDVKNHLRCRNSKVYLVDRSSKPPAKWGGVVCPPTHQRAIWNLIIG